MKAVILVAFACFAIAKSGEIRRDDKWPPPEIVQTTAPFRKICQSKTGVTDESLKEFSDGEIHDDPILKCYMQCMFVEMDGVDEHGEVHLEKMQAHIENLDRATQNILINIGKRCIYPEGDTLCEKAFWFHKCWKSVDPYHYWLF